MCAQEREREGGRERKRECVCVWVYLVGVRAYMYDSVTSQFSSCSHYYYLLCIICNGMQGKGNEGGGERGRGWKTERKNMVIPERDGFTGVERWRCGPPANA